MPLQEFEPSKFQLRYNRSPTTLPTLHICIYCKNTRHLGLFIIYSIIQNTDTYSFLFYVHCYYLCRLLIINLSSSGNPKDKVIILERELSSSQSRIAQLEALVRSLEQDKDELQATLKEHQRTLAEKEDQLQELLGKSL